MTRRRRPLTWLLALALALGMAQAAIMVSSDSTITTSVVDPPVVLQKGDSADKKRYFKSFELSTNKTSFTAEVKPRAGADTTITDVVRLDNSGSEPMAVTLTATQVTNSKVEDLEWRIMNGSSQVGIVDYLTASPSASFTLPSGFTYEMDLKVDLADGAGRNNAGISIDLTLEVDP